MQHKKNLIIWTSDSQSAFPFQKNPKTGCTCRGVARRVKTARWSALRPNASATTSSKTITISLQMARKRLVLPPSANARPLTIFPHMELMTSNACASTHSKSMIVSLGSVADRLVSNVVALQVLGPALVAPNFHSIKL